MRPRDKGALAASLLICLILVRAGALRSQEKAGDPLLNLERIFNSSEFASQRFGPASWMKDGSSYTLLEDSESAKGKQDIVLYSAATGTRTVLVPASRLTPPGETSPLSIENYEWAADGKLLLIFTNSKRVWRQNTRGDFWVMDLAAGKLKKLGGDFEPSMLQFAKFSPDGRRVGYVFKNNIYVQDLASGAITALTKDGSPTLINGTFDWVYEEEFGLRDGFRWSPDGMSIAFWQLDSEGVKDFYLINDTDSSYPSVFSYGYPQPGTENSACRIGVVSSSGGEVKWFNVPGESRDNYIPRMDWAANSREVIFQHLNRLQNRNEIMVGDAQSGEVRPIFTDQDKAWVEVVDELTWLDKGQRFIWLSERDGWNHVYSVSRQGQAQLLTPGAFDVLSTEGIDEKGGWIYYVASAENPTQRYLYRSRLDGRGKAERISPADQPGTHSYQISPSCRWAFHTFSTFDNPPMISLVQLPEHKQVRVIVDNRQLAQKVSMLKRRPVEFFRVDIGDGVLLDGWCIKPPDFDPQKRYPLFFYVYGEPAGQTVLDRWGGSGYLWHLMLAQQGYIIASVDNRGTPSPRGRAWRKCIYRQIGILASADQAAATGALLKKWPYIDPSRIGIWGWSGGGTMTLNAMFRYPDLYRAGMAVAFVADQRLYDTIYQERYMGLPADNPEGYKNGSPITFAHQLKGNLLIVHGTGDDNVHYQNLEKLANELIANNKRFTMMAYPNRTHGIYEGKNTTLHLYETLTGFLNQNLPAGPKEER
jgi:dipeptidyl-peptidase-4